MSVTSQRQLRSFIVKHNMNGGDSRCMEGNEAQDVFDQHAKLSELLQA